MIPLLPNNLPQVQVPHVNLPAVLKVVAVIVMLGTWKFGYAGGYVQEVGVPVCHGVGS